MFAGQMTIFKTCFTFFAAASDFAFASAAAFSAVACAMCKHAFIALCSFGRKPLFQKMLYLFRGGFSLCFCLGCCFLRRRLRNLQKKNAYIRSWSSRKNHHFQNVLLYLFRGGLGLHFCLGCCFGHFRRILLLLLLLSIQLRPSRFPHLFAVLSLAQGFRLLAQGFRHDFLILLLLLLLSIQLRPSRILNPKP